MQGPFFFAEITVTGTSYLDMPEHYFTPQKQQDMVRDFIFQPDVAPTHLHDEVTSYLIRTVVALNGRRGTKAWHHDSLI